MSAYNFSLRAIFIHVPKAAGSAVEATPWFRGSGHASVVSMLKSVSQQGGDPNDWFAWGIVRHPLDRFISAYAHHENRRKHRVNQIDAARIAPIFDKYGDSITGFEQFVRRHSPWDFQGNHFRRQIKYTHGRPPRYNPQATVNLLDVTVPYERLDAGWRGILRILDLPYVPLPRRNVSKRRPWKEYYRDPGIERQVRQWYEKDFEAYGY